MHGERKEKKKEKTMTWKQADLHLASSSPSSSEMFQNSMNQSNIDSLPKGVRYLLSSPDPLLNVNKYI